MRYRDLAPATVRDALTRRTVPELRALAALIGRPKLQRKPELVGAIERFLQQPTNLQFQLETMGIAPQTQGQGIGSRLIAPGLARADAQRLPCYLTTARGANVGFYQRFGFQVVAEGLPLVPGGPTHWGMRRPPADTDQRGGLP